MKKFLFILFFIVTLPGSFAAENYYAFTTEQQEQRFKLLTSELRCLVCQNQNIADSNAALASDLRQLISEKIQQGQTNQQIVDYLVARYGDFILYRPPVKLATLGLWFGPFLLFFVAISYLLYYIRKKHKESESSC